MSRPSVRSRPLATLVAAASFTGCLGGCCLTDIHGIATDGSSTGGSSSSDSSASATGGSSSGTAPGTASGTGTGNATSGGATSATSGTTTGVPPPFGLLLDAGAITIFGPVALATVPDGGDQVARLVYSEGDGGQFGILLETLDAKGRPLSPALQLATTGVYVGTDSSGDALLEYPSAPPNVTVADDGATTTVCWEDYSTISNPDAPPVCQTSAAMSSVRCASVPDDGSTAQASYSNCGASPRLVYDPTDRSIQLFFLELPANRFVQFPENQVVAQWPVGQPTSASRIVVDAGSIIAAAPLPGARAGLLFSNIFFEQQGLWLESTQFQNGGDLSVVPHYIDPDFQTFSAYATPFTAAGDPGSGSAAIFEFDGLELLSFIWHPDDVALPKGIQIPSSEPPEGAIAVGICPAGYVYLATTIRGHVLFAAGTFDGGTGAERFLDLPDFDPTPDLYQRDNAGAARPATSMALAPAPGGKLLLALSNPWQVVVYVEDCN